MQCFRWLSIHKYLLMPLVPALWLVTPGCNFSQEDNTEPPPPAADTTRKAKVQKEEPAVAAMDPVLEAVEAYIQEKKESNQLNTSSPTWRTSLPKFPDVTFDDGTTYNWNLKTNKGDIKIRFLPETAPNHVANFIYLTNLGFFDGLKFHRVITGFMAQGGCPLGTGGGSPGYRFAGEFDSSVKHDKPGLLSMANAGPGTDGSQFFLTFVATPHLDGKHTIFGEIVEGQGTLTKLEEKGSRIGRTSEPLKIEQATISVE